MQDEVIVIPTLHKHVSGNKGRLTGAKPPLRPKHVWAIRAKLQIEVRVRDLALFDLASGEFLFTGRRGPESSMTTRQYARLVSEWIGSAQKCQEPTFARLNDIQKRLSFEAGSLAHVTKCLECGAPGALSNFSLSTNVGARAGRDD